MSFWDEISAKIKLSAIISKDVKLKRQGNEFEGLCPFHKEKSPSFRVNDQKGVYYCFGCDAKGNALTYLETKLSRQEAIRLLAQMANVPLPERRRDSHPQEKNLKDLNRAATDFFKRQMTIPVIRYLHHRGINDASIEKYELGFCPNGDGLYKHLKADFSQNLLDESELFIYDQCRFKGRLMFPIKNLRGDIIAFGGRAIENPSHAKYINSKETSLFKKSETLYGVYEAAKKRKFLLVEGYLDVIHVAQQGDFSAVAPLGTSFSVEQAQYLWTFDEMPYVCFDGDQAGRKAALRLVERMIPYLSSKKSFGFLELPEGEDADSYVEKLAKLEVIPFVDKLFSFLLTGKNLNIPEHHALIKQSILDMTATQEKEIGTSYRQCLLKKLWEKTRSQKPIKTKILNELPSKSHREELLSKILLATLVLHPILMEDLQEHLGRINFKDDRLENLKHQLLESYFSSASIGDVGFLDFDQLEAYAPFIRKQTETSLAKESWMDVLEQYIKLANQEEQTLGGTSWETMRHLKADLVVGDNNNG